MIADAAISGRPEALGRLAHSRYPRQYLKHRASAIHLTLTNAQADICMILQEAVDASSTCDTARQKPGHGAMGHFYDWLCAVTRTLKDHGFSISAGFWHRDQQ